MRASESESWVSRDRPKSKRSPRKHVPGTVELYGKVVASSLGRAWCRAALRRASVHCKLKYKKPHS
eukprot:189133-Rhodomonas_salina.1